MAIFWVSWKEMFLFTYIISGWSRLVWGSLYIDCWLFCNLKLLSLFAISMSLKEPKWLASNRKSWTPPKMVKIWFRIKVAVINCWQLFLTLFSTESFQMPKRSGKLLSFSVQNLSGSSVHQSHSIWPIYTIYWKIWKGLYVLHALFE